MRCEASRSDPGMERFVAFFVVWLYILYCTAFPVLRAGMCGNVEFPNLSAFSLIALCSGEVFVGAVLGLAILIVDSGKWRLHPCYSDLVPILYWLVRNIFFLTLRDYVLPPMVLILCILYIVCFVLLGIGTRMCAVLHLVVKRPISPTSRKLSLIHI